MPFSGLAITEAASRKGVGARDGGAAFLHGGRIGAVFNPRLGSGLFSLVGWLCSGTGGAGRTTLLHQSFAGTGRQYLVGLVQDVLDVLGQGFPEVILGGVLDGKRRIVACAASASAPPAAPDPTCVESEIAPSESRAIFT